MVEKEKKTEFIDDFISGKKIPLVGSEENRQAVARMLVTAKGFDKEDIRMDLPIEISLGADTYRSKIDLVVTVNGRSMMVFKCAAGSLGSREREVLAAARLLESAPIPLSIVSDGKTAVVLDTGTGKITGKGWEAVPSKQEAQTKLAAVTLAELPPERRQKEGLIFRSYDSMNINVS